jgi:four helix bundle protein
MLSNAECKMQRTFLFASEALLAYPTDHLNARTERAWLQFVAAATSGGAHLEEAEAAASRAHFVTLTRGALRELREANYWIRLIQATRLHGWNAAAPLIAESTELIAILTTIVKKAAQKLRANRAQFCILHSSGDTVLNTPQPPGTGGAKKS